jgi:hypothetical protein
MEFLTFSSVIFLLPPSMDTDIGIPSESTASCKLHTVKIDELVFAFYR